MATLDQDSPMNGLSGRVGNLIFRRQPDGRTTISVAPSRRRTKRKLSPKQQRYREFLIEASAYARALKSERPLWDELSKKFENGSTLYRHIVKEYIRVRSTGGNVEELGFHLTPNPLPENPEA